MICSCCARDLYCLIPKTKPTVCCLLSSAFWNKSTVTDCQLRSLVLCSSQKFSRLYFQQWRLNCYLHCRSSHTKLSKRSINYLNQSVASWTDLISFCLMTESEGSCPHIWENTSMKGKSRSLISVLTELGGIGVGWIGFGLVWFWKYFFFPLLCFLGRLYL